VTAISLSPDDLGGLLTLITGFMCDRSDSYKTYCQLLATYRSCRGTWAPHDESNDLRITGYVRDMRAGEWRDDIVIVLGIWDSRVLVRDGIHRGVAYLECLENGVSPQTLPALYLRY
jgi:hypothetical protein